MRKFCAIGCIGHTFDRLYIEVTDELLERICTMRLLTGGEDYVFKPDYIYTLEQLPNPCVFFKMSATKISFKNFDISFLYWVDSKKITVRYLDD